MASKDWVSAEKQDKNSDQIDKLKNQENVPKLRFPGFNDEWVEKKLFEISDINDGTHKTPDYVNNGIPFFSVENITNSTPPKKISIEEHNKLIKRCHPKKGDILLTRIGTLAKSKIIDWDYEFSIYVSLALINSIKIYNFFLYQYLKTPSYQKDFFRRSLLLAVPQKINLKDLNETTIKYPSNEEQYIIGNFLLIVDKKIELMEKTLFLYERFAKEFIKNIYLNLNTSNKVKLRDIVDSYISNLSISNLDDNEGEYPLYGAEGVVKYINFYEMKNQYISIIKDGAGVGRLNLCNQYSSALGTLQCLIPKKEFDLHFIYYYLKNLNFKKYIVGSTIPHIYFNDYSKEKLNIPPLDIQRKYGKQCLTLEMKKKIIENAIISLKQYKKYLLQNLFI